MFDEISFVSREDLFAGWLDDNVLLDSLLENVPDIIYFKDVDSRFVKINKAMADFLDITSPDNAKGKTDFDFFPDKIADESFNDEQKVMDNNEPIIGKIEKLETLNKESRWFSTTKIPLKNKNGKIIGIAGISRDITDQKEIEKALYDSEQRYRTIFDNSAVAIMMTNEKEEIISWNRYTEKLLNMSKNDLLKKPVKNLYPENEWLKIRNENVREKGMQHHLETKMFKKNGETVDVDISVSVLKDDNGDITGSIGVIRDVTDRKKAVEELKIKDKAVRSSINAIAITDMKGCITFVNDSFLKMWGYENDDKIIGQPIVKFWKTKGKFVEVMDSLVNKGGWVGELQAERKNDTVFYAQLSATTVVDDNNKPVCMMASFVDITERRNAEQKIKESERAKAEFMNIAAHELKTPIIPLKGYLEMLLWDENIDEEKRKWLKICLRNTSTLIFLINDILDVARLESNNLKLTKEKTDLTELINGVLQDMQPMADDKNLELNKRVLDDSLPVEIDKRRISQVLRNLINNAIKCTEEGTVVVKAEKMGEKVQVSVEDTGIGIKKEDISKLFKKFSQLGEAETRKVEGTGLGLYICKGIMDQHDGKIWAESSGSGKGSTFSFSLPVKK
jgi:PAS domain S-box-containing protein